jgi:DNA-binding Xre family transcriptional regulator
MTKKLQPKIEPKIQSTYDKFVESMSEQEKKEFDREYREELFSELLLALMAEDDVSVRELAKSIGISPTIIQGIRSGTKKNVTLQSFFKIMKGLGCSVVAEKDGVRFPLNFPRK